MFITNKQINKTLILLIFYEEFVYDFIVFRLAIVRFKRNNYHSITLTGVIISNVPIGDAKILNSAATVTIMELSKNDT